VAVAERGPGTDDAAGDDGYDLQPDVERIHRAIYREPSDPIEGQEPAPWLLWGTVALALFWGGWYLGHYGGSFDTRAHVAIRGRDASTAGAAASQSAASIADPVKAGEGIYLQNCQGCHQASGRGVAGAFPPVVGSEWVTGPSETLVRILLNGLQGPVQVAGVTYNGAMPAWKDVLKDEEIGAVLTYMRQWKPNAAGPIAAAEVAALRTAHGTRTEAWTAAELRAEEGNVPAAGGGGGPGGSSQPATGAAPSPTTPAQGPAPDGAPGTPAAGGGPTPPAAPNAPAGGGETGPRAGSTGGAAPSGTGSGGR
jgi:mono/diheme cytochrome c family protein